jgi:hypothetical protein
MGTCTLMTDHVRTECAARAVSRPWFKKTFLRPLKSSKVPRVSCELARSRLIGLQRR